MSFGDLERGRVVNRNGSSSRGNSNGNTVPTTNPPPPRQQPAAAVVALAASNAVNGVRRVLSQTGLTATANEDANASTSFQLTISGQSQQELEALTDSVSRAVYKLSSNVSAMNRLTSILGTARDSHATREQLHQLTEETRDVAKSASEDIKRLVHLSTTVEQESTHGSPADSRAARDRRLRADKLRREFEQALRRFQDVQRVAGERTRLAVQQQQVQQQQQHSEKTKARRTQFSDDESDEGREGDALLSTEQQQELQQDIQYNESLIAEREQGIKEIEGTILEVNEIFRDLATLVNEQQVMFDHIESNIESAAVRTEAAAVELGQAAHYQKKYRGRMLCLFMILCLVALVIGLIVWLTK